MTIRPATKEDKELVRELWVEFQAELGGPDYLRESWDEAWSDSRRPCATASRSSPRKRAPRSGSSSASWVILGDGRPRTSRTSTCDRTRGTRAIGRALLAGIIEPARAAGLEHASLEVLIRNSDARRLYERLGFTPMDVFMVAPLGALADQLASDERPASAGSLHVQTDDATACRARGGAVPAAGWAARRAQKSRRGATAG